MVGGYVSDILMLSGCMNAMVSIARVTFVLRKKNPNTVTAAEITCCVSSLSSRELNGGDTSVRTAMEEK